MDAPVDINRGVGVLRKDNTALRRVVHGSRAARARQRGVRVRKREVVPDARCCGVEGVGVGGHCGSNGGRTSDGSHVVTDRCEWLTEDHGVRGDRVGREVGALALRREDGELH